MVETGAGSSVSVNFGVSVVSGAWLVGVESAPFSLKIPPPQSEGFEADGVSEDSTEDSTMLITKDTGAEDTGAEDVRTEEKEEEEEEVVGGGVDVVVGAFVVEEVLGGGGGGGVEVVLGGSGFLVVDVLGSSLEPSTLNTTMLAVCPLGTVTTQN